MFIIVFSSEETFLHDLFFYPHFPPDFSNFHILFFYFSTLHRLSTLFKLLSAPGMFVLPLFKRIPENILKDG